MSVTFNLSPSSSLTQKRDARKQPGTHVIRVDPFIDLPKEAFTKNTIKNYIFTGNTILRTCTEGENGGGGDPRILSPAGLPRENLSVQQ